MFIPQRIIAALDKQLDLMEEGGILDYPDEFDYLDRSEEPKTLEEGCYPARLTGIDADDDPLIMYFEICTGDFAGTEIEAETDNDLSPDSEVRDWISRILRRPLGGNDEKIDLDELEGKVCEIEVSYYPSGRPYVRSVHRAYCLDPELEEMKIKRETYEALRDPELLKRHCEEAKRNFEEAQYMLKRLREGDKSWLFKPPQ